MSIELIGFSAAIAAIGNAIYSLLKSYTSVKKKTLEVRKLKLEIKKMSGEIEFVVLDSKDEQSIRHFLKAIEEVQDEQHLKAK